MLQYSSIPRIKLIQQKQSKTLQLGKCVVKVVNFHGNKCSYGYKTLQFHDISYCNKGKVKHFNLQSVQLRILISMKIGKVMGIKLFLSTNNVNTKKAK